MKTTSLKQFCEERSQQEAANIIGCTQGAVSQMIAAGREIYITRNDQDQCDWYEVRRNTRGSRQRQCAP